MENNNNGIYDYELVYIKEEKKKTAPSKNITAKRS